MTRLLAVLAVALAFAAPAVATPEQRLADQTATWLTATLRVEVPTQAVGSINIDASRPWVAASYPDRGRRYILAEDWLVDEWRHHGHAAFAPEAGRILLHELLHGVSLDEGAVDAVALDLLPAWMARFAPRARHDGYLQGDAWQNSSYPTQVVAVRAASAAATGGRWRTREARLWRRGHLIATGRR